MQTQEDGPYILLLLLIANGTFRATLGLRPSPRGTADPDSLYICIESGDASVQAERWNQALYIAAGTNPVMLLDPAIDRAAAICKPV